MSITKDKRELNFIAQKQFFVERALDAFGVERLQDLRDSRSDPPCALRPVLIEDYRRLSESACEQISNSFFGEFGAAHFIVLNPDDPGTSSHPLLEIASQLPSRMGLQFPVMHPMEKHPEAIRRFGEPDGTLKIYDLDTKDGSTGYREQAETNEMFDAHNDGLGYGGAVHAFSLYADSVPIWGGYTYFQNIVRLSLLLAKEDPEAFSSLFLPDAITALRPRGKGAIKVQSPILFLNEQGAPQCFFRVSTGEYRMSFRENCPPLNRAASYLNSFCRPFVGGSSFVQLGRIGAGCIARNAFVVHGRTAFINGDTRADTRVLARKWFMTEERHTKYKHVPGMHIMQEYANIFPERFGTDRLEGEWNYDPESDTNIRGD